MDYSKYIASSRWRNNAARVREMEIAGGKCRVCGAAASAGAPLEAHHRGYENLGAERDGDLVALCRDCHREITSFLRRRRYQSRRPPSIDVPVMCRRRTMLFDPTPREFAS